MLATPLLAVATQNVSAHWRESPGANLPQIGSHQFGPSGLSLVRWLHWGQWPCSFVILSPRSLFCGSLRDLGALKAQGLEADMQSCFFCLWMPFCAAYMALRGLALLHSLQRGSPSLLWVCPVKQASLEHFRSFWTREVQATPLQGLSASATGLVPNRLQVSVQCGAYSKCSLSASRRTDARKESKLLSKSHFLYASKPPELESVFFAGGWGWGRGGERVVC